MSFGFWAISAETTIFIVFPGFHCFGPKNFWPKQIVCTKVRVFLPSWHKSCQAIFAKNPFFIFHIFGWPALKNTNFIGFWFFFSIFFCFYFSNIKKNKKNIFENLILTSPKFCKNTILAQCDTICVYKYTPKHYKNGENSENWTNF